MSSRQAITVKTVIKALVAQVWECWTRPNHITGWAFASDDWEAPAAENDLRVGGKFRTVMAAKNKSESFDFTGTYSSVRENELVEYDMDDGRHVKVLFEDSPDGVRVSETFDPENKYPLEMQRSGWQAILDNFRKYFENQRAQA